MLYIIGQILGIIATIASLITPFFKKKWQMLANNILINLLVAFNFILIGEVGPAAGLCMVAAVQCVVSLIHTLKEKKPRLWETFLFLALYLGFGFYGLISAPGFVWAINGRNLLETLPIIGALCSMCFVFIRDEQKARWLLLATCSVWSLYMAIVGSTAFFAQFFSVVTTVSAMIRYRRKKA